MTITPRIDSESYNIQLNQSALDILSLLFEFKIAASWHIARFSMKKDDSKHIYFKLRRMWKAHLLESVKVSFIPGMPVYYFLSQKGRDALHVRGTYTKELLSSYPQFKNILHKTTFEHDSQVTELASREVRNASDSLRITFKGELNSGFHDYRSDKNIEVFTPDYTVLYTVGDREFCIYSEFERTPKSKEAMVRKIERYLQHLSPQERENVTLRLIFQTPGMEQSFWLNMLGNNAHCLERIRIVTTNVLLLQRCEQFLEPVYTSKDSVQLTKYSNLAADTSARIKLFPFL